MFETNMGLWSVGEWRDRGRERVKEWRKNGERVESL
jgi:hypothetical protein